ncbi:MAG: bifunctional DNA-binding transcriptional regulator/O6-methylguanine-DNA methyltransferase Ada [Gammaproteobacteria bacterium]|nr:bifunctional DNA-binding transcriptional regulator/O6-methylguanine-DNA methyltransferase Ada [Gammaproteobacteria bacterium]
MNPSTEARRQRAAQTLADPRWAAVLARDSSVDEHFWYSVRTTGVYCRPSCGARTPRPENVDFHASRESARDAGFRACKRCRPEQAPSALRQVELIAEACRLLQALDPAPDLAALAGRLGLSPWHLHRLFKTHTGVTPRAYVAALRAGKFREGLSRGDKVIDAAYEAGFGSSRAVYEQGTALLGMSPRRYRSGGSDMTLHFAISPCALGQVLVAASERGICAILLGDAPGPLEDELRSRFPAARLELADTGFSDTVARVVALIDEPSGGFALPLDVRGTAFQQRVWEALRRIPSGSTTTYSELAKLLGSPKAVRAVASACAANPVAVAIPCHRVVRRDGALAGYRWGLERKKALLALEGGS